MTRFKDLKSKSIRKGPPQSVLIHSCRIFLGNFRVLNIKHVQLIPPPSQNQKEKIMALFSTTFWLETIYNVRPQKQNKKIFPTPGCGVVHHWRWKFNYRPVSLTEAVRWKPQREERPEQTRADNMIMIIITLNNIYLIMIILKIFTYW